jgi:hypothetical protein
MIKYFLLGCVLLMLAANVFIAPQTFSGLQITSTFLGMVLMQFMNNMYELGTIHRAQERQNKVLVDLLSAVVAVVAGIQDQNEETTVIQEAPKNDGPLH